jgi:nitrous oxide reductase accessory protein NosL
MKKIVILFMLICAVSYGREIKLIENNATDPIYLLPLKKYPKWICEADQKSGKRVFFSSVKSMMSVYLHQPYFIKHKVLDSNITKLYVQDYLNGRKVDAKKAKYLFGSNVIGPHGDDLIPFESDTNAKLFMLKNGGAKILPFSKISKGLIRYLDM